MFRVPSIANREYWNQLTASAGCEIAQKATAGLETLPPAPAIPTGSDFLAARRENNRGILDHHWRETRPGLSRLMLNRLLRGIDANDRDDRLLNWIYALLFEPTWMVSAHTPDQDLPLTGSGQLDLAGTEMAAEMAELREVLLPWMQQQSQMLDQSIIREIDRRCLQPFLDEPARHWTDPARIQLSNWAGVCGGALLNTCLSLETQGFARPEAKAKALQVLNRFIERAFTASGECDEGPGYWGYGIEGLCMPLARMSAEQVRAELDGPRIVQVGSYMERAHIAGNTFFAGNDSPAQTRANVGVIAWLAEFCDSSFLRWWTRNYPSAPMRSVNGLLRDLHYAPKVAAWNEPAPTHPAGRLLPDQQVALFQRPTSRGLFTFTISGGHNEECHNHNDLGTFQVFLDEVPWILDLGMPHYRQDFFSPHRYQRYMIANSSGHCCPQINGHEQRSGREAAGEILSFEADKGQFALDLTSAYPPEAGLARWVRRASVPPGQAEVQISDEYELKRDGSIVQRLWLAQRPTISGNVVRCGPLVIQVREGMEQVVLEEFRAGDDRLLMRSLTPDEHVYRAEITYRLKAGTRTVLQTEIRLA